MAEAAVRVDRPMQTGVADNVELAITVVNALLAVAHIVLQIVSFARAPEYSDDNTDTNLRSASWLLGMRFYHV